MTASTEKGELSRRAVPESFQIGMNRIIDETAVNVSVENLRNLAIHPLGNPTLQPLIDLDMSRSRNTGESQKNRLFGSLCLSLKKRKNEMRMQDDLLLGAFSKTRLALI